MSQTTSGVLRGHEGCSIPGVAQSISHPGTWRCWSSCSWRQPLSRHLGQFPALSPSLGQDSVPGGWTGMLSHPMCCQGFPSPLCGCASPVPQKRLPGFSPVHTQPVGVCSTNTSLEDAGTFCARLSSAPLGAARSRVEQKEVSDTQNSSVPGSDDRKSMFCTRKRCWCCFTCPALGLSVGLAWLTPQLVLGPSQPHPGAWHGWDGTAGSVAL